MPRSRSQSATPPRSFASTLVEAHVGAIDATFGAQSHVPDIDSRAGDAYRCARDAGPRDACPSDPQQTRTTAERVPASKPYPAILRAQANDAVVGLGRTSGIARTAVDDAMSETSATTIEVVLREALRRCPRPAVRATGELSPGLKHDTTEA